MAERQPAVPASIVERIRALTPPPAHVDFLVAPELNLEAVLVLDDLTLGPAAGGIRRRVYRTFEDAVSDALALARAMTLKTALCGLDAGGGKLVIRDRPGLDEDAVYSRIGERIEELRGAFRTAGDLGTTADNLKAVARTCRYVHADEGPLAEAVGETVVRCARIALERDSLQGAKVAVQGAGSVGAAVAARFSREGAEVVLTDLDAERAEAVATRIGAKVVSPTAILFEHADVLSPCATGGVVDELVAGRIKARTLVPGANNAVATTAAEARLLERGIAVVPDVLSSSGAVILGISRSVMNAPDPARFYAEVEAATREVLARAKDRGELPSAAATALAFRRINRARGICPVP